MIQPSNDTAFAAAPRSEPPTEKAAGAEPPRAASKRLPVTRTRRVVVGELSVEERAEICARAYAVYATFKAGVDRAAFEREYFADPGASLALFHGEGGAFAGFGFASIRRVGGGGGRHAVFSASLFIDNRYKGASAATTYCFGEALRFKLREPWTPLAFMGVMTTPASYRRLAMTIHRVYPKRGAATPAATLELMRETARLRGLSFVDEERGLVKSHGAMRDPERLRGARTLAGDPHATFYLERNPGFDGGVGMLVWVPLDAANVLFSLARYLVRGVRH